MADDNNYYKGEGQEEIQQAIQAGEERSTALNQGSIDQGTLSHSKTGSPTTKTARTLRFLKRHKVKIGVGGGVGGGLIGLIILVFVSISGTQLIWMNQILQNFSYGPWDRSIAGRSVRIQNHINRVGSTDTQTRIGQKMYNVSSEPARATRTANLRPETVSRYQRRVPFRNTIGSRISGGYNWRFFTGRSPTVTGSSLRNRLIGIDDSRTRTRTVSEPDDGVSRSRVDSIDSTVEQIKNDPSNSRRIARQGARHISRSTAVAAVMVACLSAAVDDIVPDDAELYDIYLTLGANFITSGSQLQMGEEVHGDEVADVLSAFEETIEAELGADDEDQEGETIKESSNFADSATWKRAVGEPVTGEEDDANLLFGQKTNTMSGALVATGSVVNSIPGLNLTCRFITNPLVGGAFLIAEGALVAVSGSTWAVVRTALREGGFIIGIAYMLEQLAFGGHIPEGPAMLVGSAGLGMNLSQTEHARAQGAPPITNSQANTARNEHFRKLALEDREQGFMWRYLSLENPRSSLTRVALMSTGSDLSISGAARNLAKVPSHLFASISSFFSVRADDQEEFNNYGIQQYGFSESALAKNSLENAARVEATLTYRCTFETTTDELSGQRTYSNVQGPLDANGNPTNCDEPRWSEGVLMELIMTTCMDLPYYRLLDGDDGRVFHSEPSPVRQSINCIDPDEAHLVVWEELGLWVLDNSLVEAFDCLSHDGPCRDTGAGPGYLISELNESGEGS